MHTVEVSTNGQQFSRSGVLFSYQNAAMISSLWPTTGIADGGTPLTVLGHGFLQAADAEVALQCRIGSTLVQAIVVDEATVRCNTSMSKAGLASVEVTNNGQDFTTSGSFFAFVSVIVTHVTPWQGPADGGTVVTFEGFHLSDLTSLECHFGWLLSKSSTESLPVHRVPASVLATSDVHCTSPRGMLAGWSSLQLLSHGAPVLSSGSSFFVHGVMMVSSIMPQAGPILGGTTVVVVGVGITSLTLPLCRFGTIGATVTARVKVDGMLECTAPPSRSLGSRTLEVSHNGQQFSVSGMAFEYRSPVAVSSVAPLQGAQE
jgi:hypothetical protein